MHQLYNVLAQKIDLIEKYSKRGEKGDKWSQDHADLQIVCLNVLQDKYFPSGSGFNSDIFLNRQRSSKNKLIIQFEFQCRDNGYFDRWITCEVIVTPDLQQNFKFKINWKGYKGKHKALLIDYFQDIWSDTLLKEVPLTDRSVPLH